jgi:hypothetical protein
MGDAWGGYKNGQIPTSAMYPVQGYYMRPDAAHAMIATIAEAQRHGITVRLNEAYRPLGVPADAKIHSNANGDPVSKTSTGGSNQWFQYGRMQRGETPTAAYPGGSIHGWGLACDLNSSPGASGAGNEQLVAIMKAHGFVFDIGSEPWHAHFVGIPKPVPEPSAIQKMTWKGLQGYLKTYWGYSGAVDGKPGGETWKACQTWLKAHWLYQGAIDGVPGSQTYAALNRAGCKLR